MSKKKVTLQIIPNIERVLIRLVEASREITPVLIPGQLKAGENLHCGEIVHPGNTKFKKGQIVYYSEYSASALINFGSVLRGEQGLGEAISGEKYYVVAADDIMAYEEKIFEFARKQEVDIKKLARDFQKKLAEGEEEGEGSPTIIVRRKPGETRSTLKK